MRTFFKVVSLFLISVAVWPMQAAGASRESVFDRVMRTGTIRCCYIPYPPYSIKDANTGKLSGIFIEILEEAARKLNLKIEWVDEVDYETLIEGLNTDRYDLFAGGLWPNAARARVIDFSIPLFYSAVKIYGRASENRFHGNVDALNSPEFKIATIDGEMADLIATSDFPKAQRLSLPQSTSISQDLLNVVQSKADVIFEEPGIVYQFMLKNPGTLKDLFPDKTLRIFGNAYAFKQDETRFKTMFNIALEELIDSGYVEKILKKYEPAPGIFYRVALPYQPAKM